MKQIITAYLFILIATLNSSLAQQIDITELKKNGFVENVNSIVLDQQEVVNIISQNLMHVKKTRKVLILNELGEQNIDAYLYYDDRTKIKNLTLSVYSLDQVKPIKVIKEKEFKDYNASDGFSIVTDNRIKTSGYKHVLAYPFIADFTVEYSTSNTALIPSFHPLENNQENIVTSQYQINYPADLGFQKLEKNLKDYSIETIATDNSISYSVKNLKYQEKEQNSLSYSKTMPHVLFGLQKFNLEGISANVTNWKDFGTWYYSNFVQNQQTLSPTTVAKVKELTANISTPIQKAKVLYEYMQSKTRYISIQLGIGGWKPFPASYVDSKGFGDCKALSNYMAALLKAADIDAYVTIVKAGESFEDINEDIVSIQGNHMILALPNGNDYIFIECTSQTAPFSYIDNFTDGRKVVVIKPDGAEIYKTPTLLNHNNSQKTIGTIHIDDFGAITTELSILNKGSFFDDCSNFPNYKSEDVTKMVKSRYDIIKNVDEVTFNFINDKDNFVFTENYTIKTKPYLKKMGNQFIVPLNMIHPVVFVPKSYKNRKFDFTTGRGYLFEDEFTIAIPESAEITYLPENQNIINEFGEYKIEIKKDKSNIVFKRTFLLKSNNYSNSDYDNYKKFRENISQLESMKLTYKL
jgi:transglutaminase-like putative cysteine protease